jgi:SHS2 domain-containing protein
LTAVKADFRPRDEAHATSARRFGTLRDAVAILSEDAMPWEHFAHGADIGVRGIGATRAEAFEQGALALTAVVAEPSQVKALESVDIHCSAPDAETLFVDWLNRLIFEMATRNMLFGRFSVTFDGPALHGRAEGEQVDRSRHLPAVEAKGATYTALSVAQRADGRWVTQCVVDV